MLTVDDFGVADALIGLPEASPIGMKELIVKKSAYYRADLGLNERWSNLFEKPQNDLVAFCVLGRRLEQLTIDNIFHIEDFMALAPSSPWHFLRRLVILDCQDCYLNESFNDSYIFPQCGHAMAAMPLLEMFEFNPTWRMDCEYTKYNIKAELVQTTNRDDHMLLSVRPAKLLTAENIKVWEHGLEEGRGVPLRISPFNEEAYRA